MVKKFNFTLYIVWIGIIKWIIVIIVNISLIGLVTYSLINEPRIICSIKYQ